MIRRRVFISFLVAISILMSCGQLKAEKSFLWKIQTDKGNSYLLGSVHLLKKENYPLRQAIEDAFVDTNSLVVEADMSGENVGKAATMFMQKGFYQGEESLKTTLSETNYQLVREKMKAMGMDIANFNKYKPWMLAMVILNNALMKIGFNPQYGIDMHFMGKATEQKKEILELEGIEFQLKLFDSFSKEEGEKFLISGLLESDNLGKEMDRMITAWVTGDIVEMEKLFTEGIKKNPELVEFYNKLLDVRNVGMTDKILSYLKEGKKIFVVVGAAHMIGKTGIVQALRDKGYKVDQL